MHFYIEVIGYGMLVPAVTSLVVMALMRWLCGGKAAGYPATIALVSGFLAAWILLPWAPLEPSSHWHRLPYIAIVAMMIGPIAIAPGLNLFERTIIYLLLGCITAHLLVPDWSSVQPVRHWHYTVCATTALFLCALMEPLAKRIKGPILPAVWTASACAGGFVLIQSPSMKFAQLGGAAAATFLGCTLAAMFGATKVDFRGAVAPSVVLLGGLMYIGKVNSFSSVPLVSYVLVPAALLALWIGLLPPLNKLPAKWKLAVQCVLVMIPLGVAATFALFAEPPWEEFGDY